MLVRFIKIYIFILKSSVFDISSKPLRVSKGLQARDVTHAVTLYSIKNKSKAFNLSLFLEYNMRNCCCCSMKTCWTSFLMVISYFWLFKLYMRDLHHDYRVEQIGLIRKSAFENQVDNMYLRKIDTAFKMQNFELIQMVNQTIPYTYSEEAILIISSSYTSVEGSYAHLLQKIQTSNTETDSLGYYIIRKLKHILLHNPKEIKVYTQEIQNVIQQICLNMMIRKLTIVSFEEGSLLTLRALSNLKKAAYPMISKVILINAFSPFLMVYHGNSASFLQEIKFSILKDPTRQQLLNETRIIVIDTVGRNQKRNNINMIFKTTFGDDVMLSNMLVVSSRFIWNVYCHLKPEQYFRFEPFLWIITKVFNEDRHLQQPLTIKQIENLLLFRQLPTKREMTVQTRARMLQKCFTFYMEQYSLFGNVFYHDCIRLIRKTDVYFNQNTSILIKSEAKIQVYGQNLQRLVPIDTKNEKTIYLFENIPDYRRIHIINRRKRNVEVQILGNHMPNEYITEEFINNYGVSELESVRKRGLANKGALQPLAICPGFTLLFPIHFYQMYKIASPAFSFNVEQLNGECFTGDDYFYKWIYRFVSNWSLSVNLIVFSLFCSHVMKKQTFSRFYYQLLANNFLTYLHVGEFLFMENVILASITIAIEQLLNLTVLMSDFMNLPKNLSSKIMWPPLIFQLLRQYNTDAIPSPWKVLGLQFLATTHKQNVTVLFISFVYIIEYIALDESNIFHLILICSWLTISAYEGESEQSQQKEEKAHSDLIIIKTGKNIRSLKSILKKLRKKLVNIITLCIMAICLSEDGIVTHYIIDFYIIAHILFAVHAVFDQHIS